MNDSLPTPELVETTLAERGIRFERRTGPVLHIPHGSAEVMIAFDDLAGATVIRVRAVVLDDLGLSTDAEPAALRTLNDRNRSVRFAKFVLEPGGGNITLE